MGVNEKDTEYVANLARMGLTTVEKTLFTKQLDGILQYIDVINSIKTDNIEPTVSAVDISPEQIELRHDKAIPFKDTSSIMDNAPSKEENMFKVPKIWEE